MKLWWVVSVLKCIPILTPPPPIRAHVPRSLPVSQQMLIGVTPLHSQLHCISLIICAGMTHTHTHTQGFPCCLGDEMPACVCEGQCVAGVWVRCVCVFVCWWSRGCAGVGSRRVPGFPPNESGFSHPRSAHSPQGYLGNSDRGLPSSAQSSCSLSSHETIHR